MIGPNRSHKRKYRVWHSPKSAGHKHVVRQKEIVEDYNGKDARQQVVDKYPDHYVGPATLVKY